MTIEVSSMLTYFSKFNPDNTAADDQLAFQSSIMNYELLTVSETRAQQIN